MNSDPIDHDKNSTRLEDALVRALRFKNAPEGFAERILTRVSQQNLAQTESVGPSVWLGPFSRPLLRWAIAAALSVGIVGSAVHYRQVQRERAEGEAAKQRLVLALRIASSKLQLARSKVNQITASPADGREDNKEEKE
jgi:uncharacterized protein HemX